MRRPAVIGHRGAPAYAPENTLPSFDLALAIGADHLELDIRTTRDGHLVVSHDDDLMSGTVPDAEPVSASTLAALRAIDVGSNFNRVAPHKARPAYAGAAVPALEEVLDRYMDRAGLLLEIKELGPRRKGAERFLQTLDGRRFGDRGAKRDRVLSFEPELLMEIHGKAPDLPLLQSFKRSARVTEQALAQASRYAKGICVWREKVEASFVDRARSLGLEVHVYTVNRRPRMERLVGLGVDGIITDVPDRLAEIVGSTEPWPGKRILR